MNSSEFIRFNAVKKSYDGNAYVVRGLDLSVRQGEFLTLLGPSGSGKTTSLMMLAGFEAPTSGEIYLDSRRIDQVPAHQRNIGVVFQNYALFPHMSVADNVAFPLRMRGVNSTEIGVQVKRALDMVRLVGMDQRRPAQLSGGQQQRVALARAMVFEPKLVLMDEPLGALDKQLREHMQMEIKALHHRLGINIVYVTHDQSEALTMSDRVGVFDKGVMQQLAPPDELYESPSNLFVAQFIGENNTLTGNVIALSADRCTLRCSDGTEVLARSAPGLMVGQSAALALRPEKVQLLANDAVRSDSLNVARASVTDLVYHGDHTRLLLESCGTQDFLMKLPHHTAPQKLVPATSLTIGWAVEQCRALPLH
ncbi:ABC transporter ATP-binding protein [Rhodoferax sp. GW822-FHT02A01]|uniref:ABC transporter ATP-binding protein n=1 Tax=Rhodoferax sp. GW822-FHT02A01 TaxID=3141537 RepID=UPI00315C6034